MNWGTDMDNEKLDDDALDALFAAGKAQTPEATPAFLARLNADAAAAMPRPAPLAVPSGAPSLFTRFKGLFAASGLSGAAALGVWIGFVMLFQSTISIYDWRWQDSFYRRRVCFGRRSAAAALPGIRHGQNRGLFVIVLLLATIV